MYSAAALGASKTPEKALVDKPAPKAENSKFELIPHDFKNGQPLAVYHAWKAHNLPQKDVNKAPELSWSNAPEGTKSFALIMDDPDAPGKTWVHWVVFNIPATVHELSEKLGKKRTLPNGITQGINDFEQIGYDGPYPPVGAAHRYFFKLYALDTVLDIPAGSTKKTLEEAMKGHILATAQILGTYARKIDSVTKKSKLI